MQVMKSVLWLLVGLGGIIGGLVPTWLGASYLSLWGILGSTVGGIVGIYIYTQLDL
jgi:hypothetical protein